MEFGTKIFSLFFGLSHPVLAKTNAEKRFFNFSFFFFIFFGIFLPGSSLNEIWDKIFFLSFLTYLILFWLKIMLEKGFSIFSIFLLFFSEFSCPVEYERNSGKIFFFLFLGLSHPVLAKKNARMRFFNFSNFFAIFFGIFLPGSTVNGIRD